ncbi:MAG: restriction endonuclease subunit S [Clostridia bacterium]|nr:restriction endonuclease subunit S [Clostridia bacterium]
MSRMRLKDIAVEKNERVDNPSSSPYRIFVGLEHYDSGEATIRRYGSTERLESTMKVFHAGDILIARRNVYLKRAATVDFDGLTSGDSIVLHIENEAYRRIIPFVLNTDDFWDYANQHADGSMSKRLSPKLLMEYEFSLPDDNSIDRVSNLLWAMERVKNAYRELIARTDDLVKSQFIEMFYEKEYPEYKLKELCSKITDGTHKTPNYQDSGIIFISAKNIIDGKLSFDDVKYITTEEYKEIQKRCMTEPGDVLMAKSGSLGMVAIVDTEQPLGLFESLAVLKYDRTKLDGIFLKEQLRSDTAQRQLMAGVKGVAVKHLHLNVISEVPVIVPPLDVQRQFAAFVEQSDKSKFTAQQTLKELTDAQKALMKKIFE